MNKHEEANSNADYVQRKYPVQYIRVYPCYSLPHCVHVQCKGSTAILTIDEAIMLKRKHVRLIRAQRWKQLNPGTRYPNGRKKQ